MVFISVFVVFLVVQWWGSSSPFHSDLWFLRWQRRVADVATLRAQQGLVVCVVLAVPCLGVYLLTELLSDIWRWSALLIMIPVLLYSLGRGEFTQLVKQYLVALEQGDWDGAHGIFLSLARRAPTIESVNEMATLKGDWQALNRAMLTVIGYRGFERLFAVVFWFVVLGPAGALLYRLSALYLSQVTVSKDDADYAVATRWLWLMEWPAVRLLGLSFALTGNFAGCMQAWQDSLWCLQRSTPTVVGQYTEGALGLEEPVQPLETAARTFKLTLSLLSRTWVFWMCLLAVGSLFF